MIHTSRTVTVGKTESIINEPIVLYRGDREVEVEFAIVGSKFTFTNGGNVIKSTKATHGQLVVDTPTGENMFSEVTECHEGKVVFIITKEMIDELTEVGLYSFQIRLFDESQVSRVTIPPVYQGIEIRHPMAAEDETDLVDIGLVDYSVVRKNDYENVATFLPNGDYNKTNWEEHDVISKDRLNKVEDALYVINKSTEGLYPTFQNQYDEFSAKVDKDVKAYKEEMEDEVEQFERDMTQAFGEFKVDYKDEVHERLDEVSEELEGFSSQLAHIKNLFIDIETFREISSNDTELFINAISYIENIGGGTLLLTKKEYNIEYNKITLCNNLTITSNNRAVIYSSTNNFSDIPKESNEYKIIWLFKCKDLEYVKFENIVINQTKDITSNTTIHGCISSSCIFAENINQLFINNCKIISNSVNTLWIISSNDILRPVNYHKSYITNNEIVFRRTHNEGYDATPIYVASMYALVRNNHIAFDNRGSNLRPATAMEIQCYSSEVSNNYINGFDTAIINDGSSPYHFQPVESEIIGFNIFGNNINNCRNGIKFFNGGGYLNKDKPSFNGNIYSNNIILITNVFEDYIYSELERYAQTGIGIYEHGYDDNMLKNIKIHDNNIKHITNNFDAPNEVNAEQFGISLKGVTPIKECYIYNNTIENMKNGIQVFSNDIVNSFIKINNNTVIDAVGCIFKLHNCTEIDILSNVILASNYQYSFLVDLGLNVSKVNLFNTEIKALSSYTYENYQIKYEESPYLVIKTDIRCLKILVGIDNAPRETIIAYTNNKMFNAYPFDTVKIYNGDILEKEVFLQNYNNTTNVGNVVSTSIDEYTSSISGDYIHEIKVGDIFYINGEVNSIVAKIGNKVHWAMKTNHKNVTLTRPTYSL